MSLLSASSFFPTPSVSPVASVIDSDGGSTVSSVGTEDIWANFAMYEIFPRMEGTTLEFKQSIADLHQKKIPETLCGFLNTQGGSMVFGIRDDGYITGLSCSRKVIDDFLLHIDRIFHEAVIRSTDRYERVHPSCVRTEVLTCHNGKPVVVVTVTPSYDTQYQFRDGSIWYRLNASNYKITGSEQLYTEADIRGKILQTRKAMTKEFTHALQSLRQQIKMGEKNLQMQASANKQATEQMELLTSLLHEKILQEKEVAEKQLATRNQWFCGLL
jgi:predicted HTH transcriptional regulator